MRKDGKGSCCNNQDCAPAAAERRGAHWYVKHHGQWLRVPPEVITILCFVEPILS